MDDSSMDDGTRGILTQRWGLRVAGAGRRWIFAVAVVMLFGVVTAVATVRESSLSESVPTRTVVQLLALPSPAAKLAEGRGDYWHEEMFRAGDTVKALLTRLGVGDADIEKLMREQRAAPALRALRPGINVESHADDAGNLLSLRLLAGRNVVGFERDGERFRRIDEPAALVRAVLGGIL